MTDYRTYVRGQFASGKQWSTRLHVSSTQSESALLTTMQTLWIASWTHATYGLNLIYPTNTQINGFQVSTLDGTFKEVTKSTSSSVNAGITGTTSDPDEVSIDIELRGAQLLPNQRGRMKLPAPIEGIFVDNVMSSTVGGHVTSAINDLFAGIRADGSTIFVHTGKNVSKRGVPAFTKTTIVKNMTRNLPGSVTKRGRDIAPVYY